MTVQTSQRNDRRCGHARQRLGRIFIPNRPVKEQRDGLEWWSAELGRLLEVPNSKAATSASGQVSLK